MPKVAVVDLDGTLCDQRDINSYHLAQPNIDRIETVNALYDAGWQIIIHTARGMNTFFGDGYKCDHYLRGLTERWLKENGVKYSCLVFGKPPGDIYVDDKGMGADEFDETYDSLWKVR